MNRWFRTVVAFVLVMVFATGAAAAGVIAGPARVIDGDTIVVDDVRLRIFGIDAPEISADAVPPVTVTTISAAGSRPPHSPRRSPAAP